MNMFRLTGLRAGAAAAAFAAGLLCLAPGAALAQSDSVTVTVPLQITGLAPQADRAIVYCLISKVDIGGVSPAAATNVLGDGFVIVTLTNGAYTGDVRVPLTLNPRYRPELVRSYRCAVTIQGAAIPPSTSRWSATTSRTYTDLTGHTIVSSGLWRAEGNYRIQ